MVLKGLSSLLLATMLACAPTGLISCASQSSMQDCAIHHPSMDKIFNEVALPTYKLLGQDGEAEWTGSAVAVGPRLLVTASHCVVDHTGKPAEKIHIFSKIGKHKVIADAKVVRSIINQDLALLSVEVDLPYIAEVLSYEDLLMDVKWGTHVWVSGHALGVDEPVVTDGWINSVDDSGWIRYSAPQIYGNSGGPVYGYFNGKFKVVSIAQAGYTAGMSMVTHMSLGVNPWRLRSLLGL